MGLGADMLVSRPTGSAELDTMRQSCYAEHSTEFGFLVAKATGGVMSVEPHIHSIYMGVRYDRIT